MKIHGIAYIIIGVAVGGFSLFSNRMTQSNSLLIFAYIGGLFIAIGVAKLIIKYVLSPAKTNETHNIPELEAGNKSSHPAERGLIKTRHPDLPEHQPVYCPRCNARLHHRFVYCPRCGTRIKD